MPLMFIFTGNTNTAKNIFIRNCYMFTIGIRFKIYYPSITDEEICKFIKLYLYYHTNENGDCFLKEKQLWI